MGAKPKYSSWEKLAHAIEARRVEQSQRVLERGASKPSLNMVRASRADPVEQLKQKLAQHRAFREDARLALKPIPPPAAAELFSRDIEPGLNP